MSVSTSNMSLFPYAYVCAGELCKCSKNVKYIEENIQVQL